MSTSFLPSASLETLRQRAVLLDAVRWFFRDQGFWECETPLLSREAVVDAHIDPLQTVDTHGQPLYLQTSPEAGMKRLLAAGADAIFQITRSIRGGENGRLHNPEFTMIEWYRAGDSYIEQMEFTEALVRAVHDAAGRELPDRPFEQLTYDAAFKRFAGTRVLHMSAAELAELSRQHNMDVPPGMSSGNRDDWLNLLLAELVEPRLGQDAPQFLIDYPASQAALAKVRLDTPPVSERFELYDAGIELCNGYNELTDADELARRDGQQRDLRAKAGKPPIAVGPGFLEGAMRHGLPACSGVALGFDRLAMRVLGFDDIRDVIAFPAGRA